MFDDLDSDISGNSDDKSITIEGGNSDTGDSNQPDTIRQGLL